MPNKEPQDVIITLKQVSHPRFERKENDLYTVVEIDLENARKRFKRKVKHIDGSDVEFEIKDGIKRSDCQYRIHGKGMPIRSKKRIVGRGDLVIGFAVIFEQ